MALSSDEIVKREIIDTLGYEYENITLRIFPEGSNDDQRLYTEGGLTFSFEGVNYGSCDAAWCIDDEEAVIGLEGTDALNRGSSGNAQYQRFHHALGAVKNGLIGIYYLKPGKHKIQPDLYGMAYFASQKEKGTYLIVQNFDKITGLLDIIRAYGIESIELENYIGDILDNMYKVWKAAFVKKYKDSWDIFCDKRSTIILDDVVIKYAGRMLTNFTTSTHRAGHIALGEMYLTKNYFYDKKIFYLFLKMTQKDIDELDKRVKKNKEWSLLRNDPFVTIKCIDDLMGVDTKVIDKLLKIKDIPLGYSIAHTSNNEICKRKEAESIYKECKESIYKGLKSGTITIK